MPSLALRVAVARPSTANCLRTLPPLCSRYLFLSNNMCLMALAVTLARFFRWRSTRHLPTPTISLSVILGCKSSSCKSRFRSSCSRVTVFRVESDQESDRPNHYIFFLSVKIGHVERAIAKPITMKLSVDPGGLDFVVLYIYGPPLFFLATNR